jgi:hypothetical protein
MYDGTPVGVVDLLAPLMDHFSCVGGDILSSPLLLTNQTSC